MECYLEAKEILLVLATGDPVNTALQHALAVTYQGLGDALRAKGDYGESLENLHEARKMFRRLVEQDPMNPYKQFVLGGAYYRIGCTLAESGEAGGALAAFRECLEIAKKTLAGHPNAEFERGVGSVHSWIGKLSDQLGNHEEAAEHLSAAFSLIGKAMAADPSSILIQCTLATGNEYMGDHHLAIQDPERAMEDYRKCLAIRRKICEADADNVDARGELREVLCKLGKLCAVMAGAKRREGAESSEMRRQACEWFVLAKQEHESLVGVKTFNKIDAEMGSQIGAGLDECAATGQ